MLKTFVPIATAVLSFACSIHAQGEFLAKGQNGFGLSASFGSNEDASSIGVSAGYSIKGMFDFGLGFARVAFDQKLEDADENPADLSATAISPYITFHAIKQEPDKFPLSIALGRFCFFHSMTSGWIRRITHGSSVRSAPAAHRPYRGARN